MYALLKYPELAEQVTAEADELLAEGIPTAAGLRSMDVTIGTLFHFAELKLSPADYVLGFDPVPTLSPDKKMKFEIVRLRHPLDS